MATREQAVQYFIPDHPQAARKAVEILAAELDQVEGHILSAGIVKDWADYQRRLGYCDGLRAAITTIKKQSED